METTRECPFCKEEIAREAIRCRHCRSRLIEFDPARWHRDHADRRLAGVAAAVARGMAVPAGWVRLAFVILTFIHLLGPVLYGVLWVVLPPRAGAESPLEAWLGRGQRALRTWRLGASGAPPSGPA